MAKNLRAKIPESDSMIVFDVNSASVERFVKEAEPSKVEVAKGPRDVAQKSVSRTAIAFYVMNHIVLSMI